MAAASNNASSAKAAHHKAIITMRPESASPPPIISRCADCVIACSLTGFRHLGAALWVGSCSCACVWPERTIDFRVCTTTNDDAAADAPQKDVLC